MVMEVSSRSPSKALGPIATTPSGIVVFLQPFISVLVFVSIRALQLLRLSYTVLPLSTVIVSNELHQPKALLPMLVTLAGMVMDVRLALLKAELPIVVTVLGIVMVAVKRQPAKAPAPIICTLAGMVEFLQPCTSVLVFVSIMALQLSRPSYTVLPLSTVIVSSAEHEPKALLPMLVTLAGILAEVRLEQP